MWEGYFESSEEVVGSESSDYFDSGKVLPTIFFLFFPQYFCPKTLLSQFEIPTFQQLCIQLWWFNINDALFMEICGEIHLIRTSYLWAMRKTVKTPFGFYKIFWITLLTMLSAVHDVFNLNVKVCKAWSDTWKLKSDNEVRR